jgi:hypothetical protein
MAVANGYGKVVTSGSVFMYDVGDTINSFKGKPTTNFYTNGHFSGGTGITQEGGSNATNTIIQLPNPGNSPYVLQQTMGVAFTEYQINLTNQLQSSTTYVLSGWYAESADYVGESRMFHCRAFSTSGAHVSLGTGIGTILKTVQIGGITWKFCYATITTPADYNNSFNWYVGYGGGNYTGARYYTNLMMEVGTSPSQFVDGTRSATQGLLPVIGNSTINLSNVSFDSNAQIVFDGTDDRITLTDPLLPQYNWTIEVVVKCNNFSNSPIFLSPNSAGIDHFLRFSSDGKVRFQLTTAADVGNRAMDSNYIASAGETLHAVFTRTSLDKSIYINGNLDIQSSDTTSSATWSGTWTVGTRGNVTFPLNGAIYVLKAYNRILSAAEVKQNYNKYKTRFNLS